MMEPRPAVEIEAEATPAGEGRLALALAACAALCLVAAGGLMWWKHGGAVFGSLVTAALAWCF